MLRTRLLVTLAALTSFGPMSLDLYLPGFPQIALTYGTDTAAVQLTFSAALVGLGLGQVIWGPISDRYGRRRPLAAGLALFIVASLLIVVAPTFSALVVLRLVQSLGGSAGIVVARAIVRDIYSGVELARAMSAIVTVFAVAPVLAPIIGSAVLAVGSWQWMFVVLATFGTACLVAVLAMAETLPPERRTAHGVVGAMRQYVVIVRDARFRRAAAVAAFGSMALFAYISSSPAVFIDGYGVSQGGFALLFACIAVAFTVGAQINMRLLRRFEVLPLLRSAVAAQVLASAAVLAAALAAAPMVGVVVPLAVAMMTVAAINGNGIALAIDPFPRSAASAAALVGGLQQVAGGVASALLSALAFSAAVEMGAGMLVASTLSLGLLAIGARRPLRP